MRAPPRSVNDNDLAARDAAELLYQHGVGGLLVTALAGTSMVLMLPRATGRTGLMTWLIVLLLITLARSWDLFASRKRRKRSDWNGRFEIHRFGAGVIATAAAWAIFPLLFFQQVNQSDRTAIAIIISAMAGGSAAVLAAELPLAIIYCAALLLPVSIGFLLTPGRENIFLGVLGVIFFFVMAAASTVTHRATMSAIQLNRTNQKLMVEMESERRRTQRANAELTATQSTLRETLDTLEDRIEARTAALQHEMRERERYSDELARLASTDPLTGLYNRTALADRLSAEIARAERESVSIAVLFLDLDNFKDVNDMRGHYSGDQVLRATATRLSDMLPLHSILARWGGDEFVIVLPDIEDVGTAVTVALRLRSGVADEIVVGTESVRVDATIGIATFPDHGRTPDDLIRAADVAMYAGKEEGRGRIKVFDPVLAAALRTQLLLGQALHEAIAQNALWVAYQPIVTAGDLRCESFEALLRWNHPQLGPVGPSDFIPLAERSGDIVVIGKWVLAQACRAAVGWPGNPAPTVSVNVSIAQILAGHIVEDVCSVLGETGLPARRLHLEVTESLFVRDHERIIPTLVALRAMGIRIMLDDFGTGFSSFGRLASLPIDIIKIDKSFVDNIEGESRPIIEAICSLSRAFDMKLVAEGVETLDQATSLRSMGAHYLQGYFVSRPLPESAVAKWIVTAGTGSTRPLAHIMRALPSA